MQLKILIYNEPSLNDYKDKDISLTQRAAEILE
jgi:hypothetical protein